LARLRHVLFPAPEITNAIATITTAEQQQDTAPRHALTKIDSQSGQITVPAPSHVSHIQLTGQTPRLPVPLQSSHRTCPEPRHLAQTFGFVVSIDETGALPGMAANASTAQRPRVRTAQPKIVAPRLAGFAGTALGTVAASGCRGGTSGGGLAASSGAPLRKYSISAAFAALMLVKCAFACALS
jgi:hypothetical protein